MFAKSGLENKVVVVTGGARGIGRAIVTAFAECNAEVHFFYLTSGALADRVVSDCRALGKRVSAHKVDVRERDQITTTIEKITKLTDRIDVLVNNSGIVRDALLPAMQDMDIKNVIDTNLVAVFYVTQAVIPYMMRQRSGKIINISSVAGEKGGRGQSNYAASKGALNAFTRSLAVELAKRNITVNAVAPGVVETDMSQNVRDLGGDEILSKILLKRYGKPEDVAYTCTFLASRFADYITGQIIAVDGGFKME